MATCFLSTADLAREVGLPESTVRWLILRGFLKPTAQVGWTKLFTRDDVAQLRAIVASRPRLARRLAPREEAGGG